MEQAVTKLGLETPLTAALGAFTAARLASLELRTVSDLLGHYPRKYADPAQQVPIENLRVGEQVSVFAEVISTKMQSNANGGYRLAVVIADGANHLDLTFFGKSRYKLEYRQRELAPGARGVFTGVVSEFRGDLQLTHPDYALVAAGDDDGAQVRYEATKLIPIYPGSAKAPTWVVQRAVAKVFAKLPPSELGDTVPESVLEQEGLIARERALRWIHSPENESQWRAAQERLRFEEAFVLQTALMLRRFAAAEMRAKPRPLSAQGDQISTDAQPSRLARFDAALPFTLTGGQVSIGETLAAELSGDHPMQRLLVGEVGSGKTLIALRAMLQVIDAGGQAAFLAPTEILAQQHARTFRRLLGELSTESFDPGHQGVSVALLTGSQLTGAQRGAMLAAISGNADILVGTHALLEERVKFFDLGLVVVDEQQRFGVEQREKLRGKGVNPHLLVMTATPIPRTIAMTAFGDLDTSELKEMPPGRKSIETHIVSVANKGWVKRSWERVAEEVAQGHRAFVVCPRIVESDSGEAEANVSTVEGVLAELKETPALQGLAIEAVHGQMPAAEKDAVMRRFQAGETQIIVATTVIEVGVDVPEATVMVVLDADRFGVAQLHQLRGRVGRGTAPGLCLLSTTALPDSPGGKRLRAVEAQSDGFALAQFDLEQRAEGDVLGASQAGRTSSLKLLRVANDKQVIELARHHAAVIVQSDPKLQRHAALGQSVAALGADRKEYLGKG